MRRVVLAFALVIPFLAHPAFASVKIEDLDGKDLGHIQNIVGDWTKRDEVTAIMPTFAAPTTGIFCGSTLSTAMNCENFRGRIPVPCTLDRVDLTVTTAPTGAALIVDVNECSTPTSCGTVFSTQANRPQIAVSALSGSSTTFNDTSIALGSYIGFDIDQVGSTVAGSNLTVTVGG